MPINLNAKKNKIKKVKEENLHTSRLKLAIKGT